MAETESDPETGDIADPEVLSWITKQIAMRRRYEREIASRGHRTKSAELDASAESQALEDERVAIDASLRRSQAKLALLRAQRRRVARFDY